MEAISSSTCCNIAQIIMLHSGPHVATVTKNLGTETCWLHKVEFFCTSSETDGGHDSA